MIASLIHLLILVIVGGLLVLGLFWVLEEFFLIPVPLVLKRAVGVIALLLVCLYLLRILGVA